MKTLRRELLDQETHRDAAMFLLTVIAHGNDADDLMDASEAPAWNTHEMAQELSSVETLRGKPKVLIIQACRGGEYSLSTHSVLTQCSLSTHHTGVQGR